MSLASERTLVVFRIGSEMAALPLDIVEKVVPMASLLQPPGIPPTLEGILNFAGDAVPVIRLGRLLRLAQRVPGLSSMLLIVRSGGQRVAFLVARVHEVARVGEDDLCPIERSDAFNGCVEATVKTRAGNPIHILDSSRILLEKERETLSAFQLAEQTRLDDWRPSRQ